MIESGTLRIRRATIADKETIRVFNAALARETEARNLDIQVLQAGVEAILADPLKGWYVLAECVPDSGQPTVIGQILITFEWSDWRNGYFWWLQSLYVDQHYRQQGVFRQLYEYVCGEARHSLENVCGFRLYVEGSNHTAQEIYAYIGLQRTPYQMYEIDFSENQSVSAPPIQ